MRHRLQFRPSPWVAAVGFIAAVSIGCESTSDTAGTGDSGSDVSLDGADATDAADGTADGTSDGTVDGATDGTDAVDATDGSDGADATDGVDATDGAPVPTFHGDVEPILQKSCAGCHSAGSVAPFSLVSYAETKPLAGLIAETVKRGAMPPWGLESTETCEPRHGFREDITLTAAEIAVLEAWASGGAPEGDAATAGEPPAPLTLTLPRVDISLQAKAAYVTEGKEDELVCFPLDPGLTADVWVQGVRVAPGNSKVAHHALLFTDPKGQGVAQAGEKGYYPCFGSANVDDSSLLAVWAPGSRPMVLPDNAGTPLAAGTQFVLQMHYHPLGDPQTDTTKIELMLTQGGKPEWESLTVLLGNFEGPEDNGDGLLPGPNDPGEGPAFVVPANAPSHKESMRFTSPLVVDGALNYEHRLYAVAPHMHYLGKNMVARVERRDVTAPYCSLTDVTPLIGCLQKHCSEAADLEDCVDQNCSAEYNGMPMLCNECVTYEATTSGDPEAAFGTCLAPPTFTAPEQPSGECLFEAPHYDFNWQRLYQYDAPIEELPVVRPGDVLSFECTYDNTLQNAAVAEALQYMGLEAPIGVLLGETTLDEMCLLVVQTLYKPNAAK